MDKVLSARVDEAVLQRLGILAHALGTTKKDVLERAILSYSDSVSTSHPCDEFRETAGAWKREESPEKTAAEARTAFRRAMKRHHA